jgi:hypothetical protein
MTITVRAAAKFNLHLGVGPVRDDGFHPLATVYHAIGLYDDVTVSEADRWQVGVTAEDHIALGEVPTGDDNIVVRAGKALAAHHGIDRAAKIEIHKGIPVAGGLAGGSADGAATLVALDRLWSLETSDDDLLLVESEGAFSPEEWAKVLWAGEQVCRMTARDSSGDAKMDDGDAGALQSASVRDFIRSVMESKLAEDLAWR